jgi:hypothetical protein
MQVGSLSNYKTLMNYSLVNPGRSTIDTVLLANKELALTPPSKSIDTGLTDEGTHVKKELRPTKTNVLIQAMEAELLNMKGFSIKLKGEVLGRYIDRYI